MLRRCGLGAVAALAILLGPGQAGASVAHTVMPGETLWSIAAANNFSTRALAAANGLPETAILVVGQTIQIASEGQAGGAVHAPPAAGGGYTVRRGDTFIAIAARAGVGLSRLAAANGLDPRATLPAGRTLRVPTGTAAAAPAPPSATAGSEPQPTNERVSPQLVGQLASSHGVPPSLAAAVANQESGFNNGLTSSANARGVMQILPGTWDYVERWIAGQQLNPASATENVHAGMMYLGRLLRSSGNIFMATAAYYQGEASVRRLGILRGTRRYVDSVMAQRPRFEP